MIVTLTPDKQLVLVKLYRHNIKLDTLELSSGGAEHENETTLNAAKRELLEETGYGSDNFIDLGRYYVLPSETNRWVHYYLATNVNKMHEPKHDKLIEKYFDMSVHLVPFNDTSSARDAGRLGVAGLESLHGLTLAREYLNSI